ncbi:MAG: tail fiber protein [Spirosoma sp.]|nr:tail fiber protein [Spirosoma sp.]
MPDGQLTDAEIDVVAKAIKIKSPGSVPVGTILAWAGDGTFLPLGDGWFPCDGSYIPDTPEFASLKKVVGDFWGKFDNSSGIPRFKLPDLRGVILRGVNLTKGDDPADSLKQFRDPDRNSRVRYPGASGASNEVGSYQSGEVGTHNHTARDSGHQHVTKGFSAGNFAGNAGSATRPAGVGGPFEPTTSVGNANITVDDRIGSETRPINAYVRYIIKA